jgi:hypothetical protein
MHLAKGRSKMTTWNVRSGIATVPSTSASWPSPDVVGPDSTASTRADNSISLLLSPMRDCHALPWAGRFAPFGGSWMDPAKEVSQRYSGRAEELRALADQMKAPDNRELIIRAATGYERMAAWTRSGPSSKMLRFDVKFVYKSTDATDF